VPGKSIGDFSYVGAGAVVIRSVKDGQKVFGNPARVLA
jgi:acetyltransferase-like isoleucine patch superfamily enzyme